MTHLQKRLCHITIHATSFFLSLSEINPSIKVMLSDNSLAINGMTIMLAAIFGGKLSDALEDASTIDSIKKSIGTHLKQDDHNYSGIVSVVYIVLIVFVVEVSGWAIAHRLDEQ